MSLRAAVLRRVSGPQKGEQCAAFFRNRQQDVADSERRRRGGSRQDVGDRNGESYPRYIKAFPRQRKRFFLFLWPSNRGILKPAFGDGKEDGKNCEPAQAVFKAG